MTPKLKPMMGFFGGKYRIAKHYPHPKCDTLIEPFAGSAGYALHYPELKVILVERSPELAATWRYLIGATSEDILRLPLVEADTLVSDLPISQEARWLIGLNINAGSDRPYNRISKFAVKWRPPWDGFENFWGEKRRARISRQVEFIKHWRIIEGDYSLAPNLEATWFVDPPYERTGKAYRYHELDRNQLADWIRARRGQVIACEAEGAKWMPFQLLGTFKSSPGAKRSGKTAESIWTNEHNHARIGLGIVAEGRKDDADKLDWTLLPFPELARVVQVLEGGAKRYGRRNWTGLESGYARTTQAALRHLIQAVEGERDEDHLAHAVCELLFAMHFESKGGQP